MPVTTICGATSRLIIAPAAIITDLPIVTPPKMIAPAPLWAPSRIAMGFDKPLPAARSGLPKSRWLPVTCVMRGPMSTFAPIVTAAAPPTTRTSWPIHVTFPIFRAPVRLNRTEETTQTFFPIVVPQNLQSTRSNPKHFVGGTKPSKNEK